MIQEFFYSFLSGFSWLIGLDGNFVSFFKSETGRESTDMVELAILAGLLNIAVLCIFRKKNEVDIKKVLFIALPAISFELFCDSYFSSWMPGLRSAAWVTLISAAIIYLIHGVEDLKENAAPVLLIIFGYLMPMNGSLSLTLLILTLYKTTKKADSAVLTVLTAYALLLVARIVKDIFSFSGSDIDAMSTSSSFLGASAGGAAAVYLILKLLKSNFLKTPVHIASLGAIALLFMTSRYGSDLSGEKAFMHKFSSMGTVCEITLWETDSERAAVLLQNAEKIFIDIENILSTYKPESEISKMNKSAHLEAHKCSEVLWQNLLLAKKGWELTQGGFDVTVGPLVKLWGIRNKRRELPTKEEIDKARKLVGFDKLIIDSELRTIQFPSEGFRIDFGGLTKGWAVDRARDYLLSNGIKRGIVNLGGNLYCFGVPPKGRQSYVIGIKDPRTPVKLAAKAGMLDQSISTSGNYEQFIMIDGKRYTHIINPVTGMPVSGVDSVTVIHRSAAICDMLSTGIFAGGEEVKEKLKAQPGLNFLFIDIREGDKHLIETHGPVFEDVQIRLD